MIKIYSKPHCPFCVHAKKFVTEKKIPHTIIEMDPLSDDYEAAKNELVAKTNQRTFPFIFVGEKFIGGYSDMMEMYKNLTLHTLLEELGFKLEVEF